MNSCPLTSSQRLIAYGCLRMPPQAHIFGREKKKKQVKATRQIPKCLMVSWFGKNLISPQGSTLLDTSL